MGKPSKSRNAAVARRFKATLERMRSRLNWTIIRVPFDASKAFSVHGEIKGQINVKGEINGFPFRTCLFPSRDGGHILLVNKKMQKAARVQAGTPAEFLLELDTEKRIAKTPDSLKQILAEEAAAANRLGDFARRDTT